MQVNLNLPQNSVQTRNLQKKCSQPSFQAFATKKFIKEGCNNLQGTSLFSKFKGKLGEIMMYGNKSTAYDYEFKNGQHTLSVLDCNIFGEKAILKKKAEIVHEDSFTNLIHNFLSKTEEDVIKKKKLITSKNENSAIAELADKTPKVIIG